MSNTAPALADALSRMSFTLDPAESENYKLLLCMAAGGLVPRGAAPLDPTRAAAFRIVLQCLQRLRAAGTMWSGRPGFMSDDLLLSLQNEGLETRKKAKETDRYLLGCGGKVADRFALDLNLSTLVSKHFPGVVPTGIASYIYYDEIGHGLDPHVDTEIYDINAILMLGHQYHDNPSHLLVYDEDISPKKFLLAPGEMIILNAGSVVHAREDMGPQEKLNILTIGFKIE